MTTVYSILTTEPYGFEEGQYKDDKILPNSSHTLNETFLAMTKLKICVEWNRHVSSDEYIYI